MYPLNLHHRRCQYTLYDAGNKIRAFTVATVWKNHYSLQFMVKCIGAIESEEFTCSFNRRLTSQLLYQLPDFLGRPCTVVTGGLIKC